MCRKSYWSNMGLILVCMFRQIAIHFFVLVCFGLFCICPSIYLTLVKKNNQINKNPRNKSQQNKKTRWRRNKKKQMAFWKRIHASIADPVSVNAWTHQIRLVRVVDSRRMCCLEEQKRSAAWVWAQQESRTCCARLALPPSRPAKREKVWKSRGQAGP